MTDQTADRELRLERVYAAPREAVFAAWTDPDQIARWWGPDGFEAPRDRIEVDLRVGGRFEITMVIVDEEIATGMGMPVGAEFPDRSEIVELKEPELLVLRSEAQPEIGLPIPTSSRIEFHAEGEQTRVIVHSGPYTAAMAPHAESGWAQQMAKLEALL